ncbi:polysaccharide lyase family 8 super-sandwich domain-containing protein [Pedobacter miscanthi]|nr:polysaccharide lyase family 8 super-sandwich domain-containing protein [Pedobacter miscanthi]
MKNCLFFLLFIFVQFSFAQEKKEPNKNEITILRNKCRDFLRSETTYGTEQSYILTDDVIFKTDAKGYFENLSQDGSWSDIDYKSQMRGAWRPSWHLYRTMLLYRAYHKNKNPKYLSAVHNAIAFWIKNDFKCENWWQNNINTPFAYTSLMLMLDTDALLEELTFLDKVIIGRIPVYKATGQNLIWQLDNEARVALIKNDIEVFAQVMKKMQEVISISAKEGIQPDYSFQQHGPMLQFGNYGMHFTNSLLFWMTITSSSSVAFAKNKQQIIFDYVSKGLRWSIYKKRMDITAIGRQLRENSGLKRGDNLNVNSKMIRSFDKGDGCRYMISGYPERALKDCKLTGINSFWRSGYLVSRNQDNYMISVKTHSPLVSRIESINTENLKGPFLNDGVTLIQRSGKEYSNIEPLWNWSMLPGTTGDLTTDPKGKVAVSSANKGLFTGQVSNGNIALSTLDYDRAGIKAHKSYFFFNGLMIALGADINAPNRENLITTVDQKLYDLDKPLLKGKNKEEVSWMWQDSVAYFFPDRETDLIIKTEKRDGNWNLVDEASGNKPVSGNMLTAYISHKSSTSYSYIIKPALSLVETKSVKVGDLVKNIINTEATQAIMTDNLLIAAFFKAGSVNILPAVAFSTDQSCIVIIKKEQGKYHLWIADPTRKMENINIMLGGINKNIILPKGDLSGSTIEVVL